MEITVHITNADNKMLEALKSVVNLYPQAQLQIQKKQEFTQNGYTKEFEQEILEDLKEIQTQKKAGVFKTYENVREAFAFEGLIK